MGRRDAEDAENNSRVDSEEENPGGACWRGAAELARARRRARWRLDAANRRVRSLANTVAERVVSQGNG